MNIVKRKKMVLAMEFIARQINDEEVFESWLINGVVDGDIMEGEWNYNKVDDYYITDDALHDLMSCFLRRMSGAWKSGGLYCDKVVSEIKDKN